MQLVVAGVRQEKRLYKSSWNMSMDPAPRNCDDVTKNDSDDEIEDLPPTSPLQPPDANSNKLHNEEVDDDEEARRRWARENLNDKSFSPSISFDDDGMTTATTATRVVYHQKPVIILSRKTCWLLTLAHFAFAIATVSIYIAIFVISSTRKSGSGVLWKGVVCGCVFLMSGFAGIIIAWEISFKRVQVFLVACVLSALAALLLLILSCITVNTSSECAVYYSTSIMDIYHCQSMYYVKVLNIGYIVIAIVELIISLWPIVFGRRAANRRKTQDVVEYVEDEDI
ncbi:PREDICTED: uncharacterized protein LOC106808901 isoform X1 [Priapulus caudatus]|uniref:Uncharacterized protein LOC106808901 isoform X1 n=1 Tax=Priapulus caudatus TaxID=37621 RepID=A0ABM1E523_PRICU|nr:PREDICTED: uncharacterized protein LOC106808901 isoform X1 [Priapulus caudatus]